MAFVGLTYDLRSEYVAQGLSKEQTAEFDRDDTIEALEGALAGLGHRTERIGNGKQLAAALVSGRRWDLVFNIAEGLCGVGREAQVPALLDLYRIPYTFSDPLVLSLTLHKGMTKRVVRDAGVPTADFIIVHDEMRMARIPFDPPFFIKPVNEGTGIGISAESIVRHPKRLKDLCRRLIGRYGQPVLVEPYLPGREFTVGIIGTGLEARAVGTIEVTLKGEAEPGVYSYVNKERCEDLVVYHHVTAEQETLVAEVQEIALKAWRVLECRDAGRVDIRCNTEGRPMFMEINPLAGIHPEHSDLPIICGHVGISYPTLIRRIVESAVRRAEKGASCE